MGTPKNELKRAESKQAFRQEKVMKDQLDADHLVLLFCVESC